MSVFRETVFRKLPHLNVQHWRDEDDEDAPDNEYEAVMCKAGAN